MFLFMDLREKHFEEEVVEGSRGSHPEGARWIDVIASGEA